MYELNTARNILLELSVLDYIIKNYIIFQLVLEVRYSLTETLTGEGGPREPCRYGLDSPGIDFRRRRDFSHFSRPALRLTQSPIRLHLLPLCA